MQGEDGVVCALASRPVYDDMAKEGESYSRLSDLVAYTRELGS